MKLRRNDWTIKDHLVYFHIHNYIISYKGPNSVPPKQTPFVSALNNLKPKPPNSSITSSINGPNSVPPNAGPTPLASAPTNFGQKPPASSLAPSNNGQNSSLPFAGLTPLVSAPTNFGPKTPYLFRYFWRILIVQLKSLIRVVGRVFTSDTNEVDGKEFENYHDEGKEKVEEDYALHLFRENSCGRSLGLNFDE